MYQQTDATETQMRLRHYANLQTLILILTLGTFKHAIARSYDALPPSARRIYDREIGEFLQHFMLSLMNIQQILELMEEDRGY